MKSKAPFPYFAEALFLLIISLILIGWTSEIQAQNNIYLESKIKPLQYSCPGAIISADGKYLVKSYSRNPSFKDTMNVLIFNTFTLKLVRTISIRVNNGYNISLSEDGQQIIAQYYEDGTTVYSYFNIETGLKTKEVRLPARHGYWSSEVSEMIHDSLFSSLTPLSHKIKIYNNNTKVTTELMKGEGAFFCNQGSDVLTASGKKLFLVNVSSGKILDEWKLPDNNYVMYNIPIRIAPDSKHFAVVCSDSKTYYGVTENGKIKHISTFDSQNETGCWVEDVYFVPGDEYIFLVNHVSIQKFNAKTGQRIFSVNIVRYYTSQLYGYGRSQELRLINRFGNDYLLLTDKANMSYLFSLKTNTVVAFLYSWGNRDYTLIAQDSRMEGTPGAIENLQWVKDDRKTPLASTYDQMYTPNLMSQVLSNTLQENQVSLENIVNYTPEIIITSPKVESKTSSPQPEFKTSSSSLPITCELKENGDEITQVRIYVNDKLVSDETRGMKATGNSATYSVTLLPGVNSVKAIAITKNGYQSGAAEVIVTYSGTVAESKLFILAIGIDKYKNPAYNLNYAVADASAIVERVRSTGLGIFKSINIYSYQNEKARRDSILTGFNRIAVQAQPQDAFILFYAGHGVMSEGTPEIPKDFYLVLHNVTQLYGKDDILKAQGISAVELRELSQKITAQKQVVFLDACQSGAAVETFAMRGAAEEKAILQLARSTGSYLIASTGTEQYATEFKEIGHGIFTYTLLQGMNCNAAGAEKDKKITIKELEVYLNDNMPALTEKYHGTVQYPKSWSKGMDFPIAVCK